MITRLIYSFTLLIIGHSKSCPSYECTLDSAFCLNRVSGGYYRYNVFPCPQGYYCDTHNRTCSIPRIPISPNQGHGAFCNATYTCKGSCLNNKCVGHSLGSSCSTDLDCDNQTFCRRANNALKGICSKLIPTGSSCRNVPYNYACEQGSGCLYGTCIHYYSLYNESVLPYDYCNNSSSMFCESSQCYRDDETRTAWCIEAYKSTQTIPVPCQTDEDCIGISGDYSIIGSCMCSYNNIQHISYCASFAGDTHSNSKLFMLQRWYYSTAIKKCNIMTDMNLCMLSQWNYGDYYNYLYSQYMSIKEPIIIGAQSCVLDTLEPQYKFLRDKTRLYCELSELNFEN